MSNSNLILIGGGGHCKSVLDSILMSLDRSNYSKICIVDKKENVGRKILNIPIVGFDDDLVRLRREGYDCAFITIGSVGVPDHRIKLFNKIEKLGFIIPNIIDDTAVVSSDSVLETGIFIGKNAVINAGTTIGKGAIINTSSTIEHDCIIERFAHIAPGSVLCGGVRIGENSHIGANSVIKQSLKIGANTIVGMGSVVLKDVASYKMVYGNPCKET